MSSATDKNTDPPDDDADTDRWEPIRTAGRWRFHLKTHVTVLLIVIVAEFIGTKTYPVGPGQVVILPMLYAVVIGILLGYRVLGAYIDQLRQAIPKEVSQISAPLIVVTLMPLGVKYGTLVAPNFYDIVGAGPAFVLQELGNLGTIFLALPIALLLGLKRESIGAAVSIAREPTLGIITDLYGPDSPEGIGVLGTYLTGTFLGTLFFGLLGGLAPITGLHPRALAMACGIGSGSMMTACSASLAEVVTAVPEDEVLAFAATSNLLTGLTGVYVVLFVAVPLINKLYEIMEPVFGGGA
ncbi:DUF3100 domain-containing protein [Halobacteriales archaeon QS_1_68_17]|nr:MAG: DUF3100 domain-containing protein [Halobacteriales archaeon QS_1_68_17]